MSDSGVPIRLLDLDPLDPLRSQTIYHAVGYSMTADLPDTIMLVSPNAPYVSIGRHQDVDREVDREVCAELGFAIIRREIGGGAVYLDGNQLFTQWIFAAEHLPATVEERFALYCDTLVQTYRTLGIEAAYRPVNDIHVSGRKIGGTGAARMDRAEVVVGSLMFDFDTLTMSRVLKVPSEKFRDKIFQTLQEYMTTMSRELGEEPDRATVVDAYIAVCSAALGRPIERGSLRQEEIELAEQLDARFASQEWLEEGGGLRRAGVKIHEGVRVAEGANKAAGGMIRCVAVIRDDTLDDVAFSGDFTARPANVPERLAEALMGCTVSETAFQERVTEYYEKERPETPGVAASDWVTALMQATTTTPPA